MRYLHVSVPVSAFAKKTVGGKTVRSVRPGTVGATFNVGRNAAKRAARASKPR